LAYLSRHHPNREADSDVQEGFHRQFSNQHRRVPAAHPAVSLPLNVVDPVADLVPYGLLLAAQASLSTAVGFRCQRRQPVDQTKTRHNLILKRVGRPELRDRTVRRPARLERSDARIGRHHVPTPLAVVTTTDVDRYVEMPDPGLRVRNLARMLDRGHLLLPTHAVLECSEAEAREKA